MKIKTKKKNPIKEERKRLRFISRWLEKGLAMNCKPGGDRHNLIKELLDVALRRAPQPDLILAAQLLISYNDRAAWVLIDTVAENDYPAFIKAHV